MTTKKGILVADNRRQRMRFKARAGLALAGLALVIAAVPASASAEVRTGLVEDPQGDTQASLSGKSMDLQSVAIRYDTEGTLRVTWTYYDDVRAALGTPTVVQGDAYPAARDQSNYAYVNWSLQDQSSMEIWTHLDVSGVVGTLNGIGTMSDDGRVITAEFSHPVLAGRNWVQGLPNTRFGDSSDQFWFDGYAPPPPPPPPPVVPSPVPSPGPTPPTPSPGTPPPSDPGAAPGTEGITVNDGALYTNDPDVTLSVITPAWANWLRVSNDGGFLAAKTFPVSNTIPWHLAESGPERLPKTVYLRFGNEAQTFTDDIILDQTKPTISSATVDASGGTTRSAAVAEAIASSTRTYRVRVHAKDATSGVAKVQFAAGSKRHPSAVRKFTRISTYKGSRAPKYVRVQDRAGNFSSWRSVR